MQKLSINKLLSTLNDVNRAQVSNWPVTAICFPVRIKMIYLNSPASRTQTCIKQLTLKLLTEKSVNLIPMHPSTLQVVHKFSISNPNSASQRVEDGY